MSWEAGASSIGGSRTMARTRLLYRRAEELLRHTRMPDGQRHAYPPEAMRMALSGVTRFYQLRWGASIEPLAHALQLLDEQPGATWETEHVRQHLAWAAFFTGELPLLRRQTDIGLARAMRRADRWSLTGLRIPDAFRLLAAGDTAAASDSVESAMARWETGTFHAQHLWATYTWPHIDLYADDPEQAWERLEQARAAIRRSLLPLRVQVARTLIGQLRGGVALALLRAGIGRRSRLLREVRRRARGLVRERGAHTRAHAHVLKAGLERLHGRDDAAVASLLLASDTFAAAGMELYRAACQIFLGEVGGGAHLEAKGEAEAILRGRGVAEPRRFAAALLPGVVDPG
jgi:hypothetical protein